MAKPHSFPLLFDSVKSISTADLKKAGYFRPGYRIFGDMTFSRNGNITGSISVTSHNERGNEYVQLDYVIPDTGDFNYQVPLIKKTSNLGKGFVWYFYCPVTGKLCRKLYFINGRFSHRSAARNAMYDCQTQSKKYRAIEKMFGPYYQREGLFDELNKKYSKNFYAGKPTRRFKAIMKRLQATKELSVADFEKLMTS